MLLPVFTSQPGDCRELKLPLKLSSTKLLTEPLKLPYPMSGLAPVAQAPVVEKALMWTVPLAGVVDNAPDTFMPGAGAAVRTITVAAPPKESELSESVPVPPLPLAKMFDRLLA